jgi:formylglycine-generating enzyme required for sulfatase activity
MNQSERESIEPSVFEPRHQRRTEKGKPRFKLAGVFSAVSLMVVLFGVLIGISLLQVVMLQSTPDTTEYELTEGPGIIIGNRVLSMDGVLKIQGTAHGYSSQSLEVEVGETTPKTLTFELARLPGILVVEMLDPADAEISVDGISTGENGTSRLELKAGSHEILVGHPRYYPMEITLDIEGKGQEQTLPVRLQPAWVTLVMESDPSGAEVSINDNSLGKTPHKAELMPGVYEVRYRLDGYEDELRLVEPVYGEENLLPAVSMTPARASIRISSTPGKASIFLNDSYSGTTPARLALRPNQTTAVKITKAGYADFSTTVSLSAGQHKALAAPLKVTSGVVNFVSQPEAQIWINGRHQGGTPQEFSLQTIPQNIEFRREGYRTVKFILTPRIDASQSHTAELLTESEALKAEAPSEYRSAAGQKMILVKPAHVRLGSPASEPGRRANEVAYNALLTRWFYVSAHEVTRRQFAPYALASQTTSPGGNADFPVVNIAWEDAALYCNWLSQQENLGQAYKTNDGKVTGFDAGSNGYRLLTEAEWTWVAGSGNPGTREQFRYPWGDGKIPSKPSGNYADESAKSVVDEVITDYRDGYPKFAAVGEFEPNIKGVYDMGGNVSEWVNDFYHYGPMEAGRVYNDPTGPIHGIDHVVKGSNWASASQRELRIAYRGFSTSGDEHTGFRIGRWLE